METPLEIQDLENKKALFILWQGKMLAIVELLIEVERR